jgi:cytoskeleton protein RodZ
MGLASGKTKLKLIDIDSSAERDFTRARVTPSLGMRSAAKDSSATVATSQDGATEIGRSLREAREHSGQTLRDASRNLRIRLEYLLAIENGDFKALPGMTYAIGYVRTYAQYLGLDVERAISLFKTEASELNGPRQLIFPSPAPEGKVPGGALMFVAAFLAVFAYAGWYYVTDSGRAVAGYTLAVPEALRAWLNEKPKGGNTSDSFSSIAVAASQGSPVEVSSDEPAPDRIQGVVIGGQATATGSSFQAAAATPLIAASAIPAQATPDTARTAAIAGAPKPAKKPMADTVVALAVTATPEAVSMTTDAAAPLSATQSAPETPAVETATSGRDTEIARPAPVQSRTPAARPTVAEASIPQAPTMNLLEASTTPRSILSASVRAGLSDRSRIVIQASAASWVQVRAADSTTVMTKVMRAGDIYEVPDRDGLRLFTGNAGALTILVDGKEVPKLGGAGQIARNVDLEPEPLKQRVN